MALELPFGIKPVENLSNIDERYGTYQSVGEALIGTQGTRALGLTVGVIENSEVVEYWFSNGIGDVNLIKKIPSASQINFSDSTSVEDGVVRQAPIDGIPYIRKDGQWHRYLPLLWEPVPIVGFRPPTEAEWIVEKNTWTVQNYTGAFNSPLKLPGTGYRYFTNGKLRNVGTEGGYWSSTVSSNLSIRVTISQYFVNIYGYRRATGLAVRLIKDEVYTGNAIDFVSETVEKDGLFYNTVLNPITGRVWLDRNLGATQVATSSTDSLAYGDLYQWGRGTDGHEKRNSLITSILSNTDEPGHGYFIITNTSDQNWRSPNRSGLWQGISGINLPTIGSTTHIQLKFGKKININSIDM